VVVARLVRGCEQGNKGSIRRREGGMGAYQ
jgi:hypothetical protein